MNVDVSRESSSQGCFSRPIPLGPSQGFWFRPEPSSQRQIQPTCPGSGLETDWSSPLAPFSLCLSILTKTSPLLPPTFFRRGSSGSHKRVFKEAFYLDRRPHGGDPLNVGGWGGQGQL